MKKIAFALLGVLALAACEDGGSSYSYNSGDSYNRVVNVTNTTGMTMTHFYASNSNSRSWGPEQLGPTTVLPSGQYTRINFDDGTGACVFDFKARFNNGQELLKYGVNVCSISNYNYVR